MSSQPFDLSVLDALIFSMASSGKKIVNYSELIRIRNDLAAKLERVQQLV